ncbi:MAG: hypothetical protein M1338_04175 [Patescibacteria group bacterium]|nr:hypothetical protein [Patescibacteria group bacterium]
MSDFMEEYMSDGLMGATYVTHVPSNLVETVINCFKKCISSSYLLWVMDEMGCEDERIWLFAIKMEDEDKYWNLGFMLISVDLSFAENLEILNIIVGQLQEIFELRFAQLVATNARWDGEIIKNFHYKKIDN